MAAWWSSGRGWPVLPSPLAGEVARSAGGDVRVGYWHVSSAPLAGEVTRSAGGT
jgi:hypothetical protein